MAMAMGRPLLGDEDSGQEEHRHGEEKAIPGRAASADALLQLGDERVEFICADGEKETGGVRGQHGDGWWWQELQTAPRDRRMEADSHRHGQNSTHVHLLAPNFWLHAAHCGLPGGLEGSVASGGYESTRRDPETVALFPDHMLGVTCL